MKRRLYDDELKRRAIRWREVRADDYGGTHDPECSFCGEEIEGYFQEGRFICCESCGKEMYLGVMPNSRLHIVGLKSTNDVLYENWLKAGKPAL